MMRNILQNFSINFPVPSLNIDQKCLVEPAVTLSSPPGAPSLCPGRSLARGEKELVIVIFSILIPEYSILIAYGAHSLTHLGLS